MDAQLMSRCNTSIQWLPFLSKDGAGDKTFKPAIPLEVYLDMYPGITISRDGEDRTVKGTIIVDGDLVPGLTRDDEFVVPVEGRFRILHLRALPSIQGEGPRVVIYL